MERRSQTRKRESEQPHDRRGKITKKALPLYFFPPLNGGRLPVMDDALNFKVALKTTNLRKGKRLQDEQHMSLTSSLRDYYKEEFFHNTRQDKERLNYNGEKNFVATKRAKKTLFLPPLTTRTLPRTRNSKQADKFATHAKTTHSQKTFPKHLPKIKTRKPELRDVIPGTPEMRIAQEAENLKLPLLTKGTVKPLRAAISSSATLRGLITLDLEEQFVLRFRLSNYDAKDINTTTLNEPV